MSGRIGEAPGSAGTGLAEQLPDAAHIGGVHLQVGDLQRSIDYYRRVLGLEVLDRDRDRAALGVARAPHPLVRLAEKRGAAPAPRRGRFGLYHFAILLPDRAALGRFAAHLFALGLRPGMADHDVSEALYLSDPDGLGIEVYADRPRASWKRNGDERVMTPDPLDSAGVVAAGEEKPWTGAPDGTTMGHVHLHVGDLVKADAFYSALGFAKTVWSYPGALFFGAGGYHHHLGTNVWSPGPSARADEARLVEWELVVPGNDHLEDVARRLAAGRFAVDDASAGVRTSDPWGTPVHVTSENGR